MPDPETSVSDLTLQALLIQLYKDPHALFAQGYKDPPSTIWLLRHVAIPLILLAAGSLWVSRWLYEQTALGFILALLNIAHHSVHWVLVLTVIPKLLDIERIESLPMLRGTRFALTLSLSPLWLIGLLALLLDLSTRMGTWIQSFLWFGALILVYRYLGPALAPIAEQKRFRTLSFAVIAGAYAALWLFFGLLATLFSLWSVG